MVRLHQPASDFSPTMSLPLPTRVLKHALVGHGLHFGGRVLLVGGVGEFELDRFLEGLGYRIDVIDQSFARPEGSRNPLLPNEFYDSTSGESAPTAPEEFDLILVQDLRVYGDNLLEQQSRAATANLLARLRPGGDLIFIQKQIKARNAKVGHHANCWNQHLACFPGQVESTAFRESLFEQSQWDWLFGTREHADYFTVTLQSPHETLGRDVWREVARRGPFTAQTSCCLEESFATKRVRRAA